MPFSYDATINDTNDSIPDLITSAVNSAVVTIEAEVSGLETQIADLKTRIKALEDNSTPAPAPADATVVSHTALSLGNATTPKAVAKPANVQAGDLLLMIVSADWGLGTEIGPSNGFTQIKEHDLGTDYLKVNVAYKVAGSSEPSTYPVDVTTNTDARVDLIAIRNAKTSGPIAVSSVGVIDNTNLTSAHTPEVVPSTGKGLHIATVAVSKSQVAQYDYSFTAPTGMTELTDTNTGRWIAMSTAYATYNSISTVPSKGFGLSTTATKLDKILISLVVPSVGS